MAKPGFKDAEAVACTTGIETVVNVAAGSVRQSIRED
jgi:hypothetical protein